MRFAAPLRRGHRARRGLGTALVAVAVLGCAAALSGCGGAEAGAGSARLWVTAERGHRLLLDVEVPAGQTVLRALRAHADVDTRYGGRFVQAIDGLEGDGARRRDWFWFLNGLTADRSAAEVRLRSGDVVWWDYRDWTDDPQREAVVGAFPEPFVHGYAGRVRPTAVRHAPGLAGPAGRVAELLGAGDVAPLGRPAPDGAHLFELRPGPPRFEATLRTPGAGPESPVRFTFAGNVDALLDGAYARRYEAP